MRTLLPRLIAATVFFLLASSSGNAVDLERLKYNNPELVVDLGVGLWAWRWGVWLWAGFLFGGGFGVRSF